MQARRIDRIEEQIRIEVSEIIEREIHDPRVHLVSITGVDLSKDGRHARIYVSSLGNEEDRRKLVEGLRSASQFIRRSLSHRLAHMKRVPELRFEYDTALERANRIGVLLENLKTGSEPGGES